MVILSCLSLINIPDQGKIITDAIRFTSSGFILHLIAYFFSMLLGYYAYGKNRMRVLAISVFFYSFLLEVIQNIIPTRTFNIFDIIANTLGIISLIIILKMKSIIIKNES